MRTSELSEYQTNLMHRTGFKPTYTYMYFIPQLILCNDGDGCRNSSKRYVVRFVGNNSKCWDSKEVWMDPEILDEL